MKKTTQPCVRALLCSLKPKAKCLKQKAGELTFKRRLVQIGCMLLLCLNLLTATAQNTITGTVRNTAGEPLPNATVTVVKTNKGTITNAKGAFILNNVASKDQLRVSLIGYAAQTLAINGQTNITITLKDAVNELDRVVVQAYGITSQRLATGNIGKLTAKDIEKQPVMNVLDALQGQVPGVVVSRGNGYASSSIKVEIRGRSTINPNIPSEPLYIVDGVPLTILSLTANESYANGTQGVIQSGIPSPANGQSPLFNLNPADIESIEVLKDADATAIYGSRAANGVILITTKKGKAGKAKLNISVYSGNLSNTRFYPMLNTRQYVEMRKEALKNDGRPINENTASDLLIWDTLRYTDWQKAMWEHVGRTIDANLALSGGDVRTNFRLAGSFHSRSDILTIGGNNLRGGLTLNMNHRSANGKLVLGLSAIYTVTAVDTKSNPSSIQLPPNAPPVYDENGNLNFAGWGPLQNLYSFGFLMQSYKSEAHYLNTNMLFNYEILKGLNIKVNIGYNAVQSSQDNQVPIKAQNPAFNPTATYSHGSTFSKNILAEPQLEYNKFILKGKLTVLAGSSYQQNKTEGSTMNGFQIPNDVLISNISSAPNRSINYNIAWYKYIAMFGRINYNRDNRYLFNINIRRDGSSKFGPGKQFGNFGSIGGAYIFSETGFFKNTMPFISFGKLRGSYGTTGNDQIPNYQYLTAWSFNQFQYNGSQVLIPTRHTDSTFQWQVNRKLELAGTLSFFENALTIDVSWYRNRCDNQLVSFPTPSSTGFGDVLTNSPANVQNTGWELALSGTPVNKKTLKISSRLNIGINRNKLLSYPDFDLSPYTTRYVVGQSLNIIKVLQSTGVDPQTGQYTFKDFDEDGKITIVEKLSANDDRYFIDPSVKFDGGLSNSLSYKRISMELFFYFRKKLGRKAYITSYLPGQIANQPVEVLDRWQKPGDHATIAAFTTVSKESYQRFSNYSDGVYTDASFIRLQNLSIGYSLTGKYLSRIGVSDCKINIAARNLFVISPYKGADPEIQSATVIGIPRVITAGLSLNF